MEVVSFDSETERSWLFNLINVLFFNFFQAYLKKLMAMNLTNIQSSGHNNLMVFTKHSRKSALKLSVISSEQLPYEGCLRKNIFSNLFILTVSLCKSIFRSFALESKNKKKVVGGEGKYRKKKSQIRSSRFRPSF